MNDFLVFKFTNSLFELMLQQGFNLQESLEIISKNKNGFFEKRLAKAALEIRSYLMEGALFSTALKKCSYIKFESLYVSFVGFSELSGNLNQVIQFLNERCLRKKEKRRILINAAVYPLFVFSLVLGIFLYLTFGCNSFFDNPLFNNDSINKNQCVKFFVSFLSVCSIVFYFILTSLRENKVYEAFLATGFLIQNGYSLSLAMGYGGSLLGAKTREGKIMLSARQKLEFGMDLFSAFGIGTSGKNDFCRIPGFENALFYAQKGGSKADVFAKIAGEIKLRDDQKRKICMSLIEPAFIGLTGLFLIGLVMNYVLPVIESMGMFL